VKVWRWGSKEWKDVDEGIRRKVVATVEGCMIAVYEIKKGAKVPMHNHPEMQMGVIIEGKGMFRTGGGDVTLVKGDSYSLDSGEYHEFEALEDCIVVDLFIPAREDFKKEVKEPDIEA